MANKKNIIKYILTTLWCCIGAVVIVLLVSAVRKEEKQKCKGLNVVIEGASNNFFVDKQDILDAINQYIDGSPVGKPVNILNLRSLENDLKKNIWVKKSQLFFDNNTVLQVIIEEREPVARVFSTTGTTFYIDSSLAMLPLSDKFSARLPVFTGFPSDKKVLTRTDSNLLRDVSHVSMAIQQDSFLMAMIDQVDIAPNRTFEMLPKIGNTTISFGNGKDAEEKFRKLKLFYKEVIAKSGWNKYSMVDVQYKGQVVAKRKDRTEIVADSMKTLQLMKTLADNAEKMATDSIIAMFHDSEKNNDISMIEQSVERDDEGEEGEGSVVISPVIPVTVSPAENKTADKNKAVNVKKTIPVKKPAVSKPGFKPTVKALVSNKPKVVKPGDKKPKAVMPAKNDY